MDLEGLYHFMEKDIKLRRIKERLYGLKPANYATVFEGVVKTIIQQQISLIGSMHITTRLILKFGEKVKVEEEMFYEFPSPEALVEASLTELKECGLSRQKATYIKEFSKNIVGDGFDSEEVIKLSVPDAIEKLTQIKGVGLWTAELVIVTCTDHKEVLPAGDLGVRRAISNFTSRDLMKEEEIRKFTEKWEEFKALISYYLICNERLNS
jgi:DNA-3-methyladenine glycosylase II